MATPTSDLSMILPRVLIVSRRTVRKNKFVDFVGEYHLDLIVGYGAAPVIVPRVAGVQMLLDSFEPIHGVLLCEGEDIDPSLYDVAEEMPAAGLSPDELDEVRRLHASDAVGDREKDNIELRLARRCLQRNVPFLGICRGSQVLNVACGGTLYQDVECELAKTGKEAVAHIDYDNYDGHRHPVTVEENTPLHSWFRDSLQEGKMELMVNSYHHQGVKRLADRFVPMAFAPDGLIEGFYDPDAYNPEQGKFIMGLQFHPERMRQPSSDEFDYPGCPAAYQEFVKAVIAYQKKVNDVGHNPKDALKMDQEMEKRRKIIVRSFSIAKNLYDARIDMPLSKEPDLEAGAEFLDSNTALSLQQDKRLKQMGATVRNASSYLQRLKLNEERERVARVFMERMSAERLSDLLSFYHIMEKICSEVLEKKLMNT
ncbi:uncharacterized protein LOC109717947 [Ananas comosus]|uniref:Protein NtpR n=1 Tax=Ananas comosus TaxID=4615 RepID=A0A199VGC4_ANACO|nr:uncharacterized protein LOC109717947 [Ananas comosus]OAY75921.1 Protein NtpR [Ananas comosus]